MQGDLGQRVGEGVQCGMSYEPTTERSIIQGLDMQRTAECLDR